MNDDFFDDPFDNEESSGSFKHIAKVRFSFAWQGGKYNDEKKSYQDTRKYFPFIPDEKREIMYQAKEECQQWIDEEKVSGFPQLGILLEIPLDTFLTAHEKMTWDVTQFTNSYHSTKRQMGEGGKLDEAQQKEVKGLLPYDMAIEALRPLKDHFNKFVWVHLSQEINWFTEAHWLTYEVDWARSNSDYPNRLYVVNEIISEKEAYEAAGVSLDTDDDFADFEEPNEDDGLSTYAVKNGWSLKALQNQAQQIHDQIAMAIKGENTPDKKPLGSKEAQEFVCANYVIEVADLKLIPLEEIAF